MDKEALKFAEGNAKRDSQLVQWEKDLRGKQYFGGDAPSAKDCAAVEEIGTDAPHPLLYPNLFAWWTIVHRFRPEIQHSWK